MPQKSKPVRRLPKDKKTTPASQSRSKAQDQLQQQRQRQSESTKDIEDEDRIDVSATIPITLQQLLLNVFKSALLAKDSSGNQDSENPGADEETLDIKSLIQKIKSHLYNRDFDSAFADADEELLRAYALRWSAARALGYAGLLKSMLSILVKEGRESSVSGLEGSDPSASRKNHVVSIGGGAGAEIVALAAAWRDLVDEGAIPGSQTDISSSFDALSLVRKNGDEEVEDTSETPSQTQSSLSPSSSLSITAVDIGDWSTVVQRLTSTIQSPKVQSTNSYPAPLLNTKLQERESSRTSTITDFKVNFERLDVLSLSDQSLKSLFHPSTTLVTLMFTLNELFSTSLPKTTSFLLRTTDLLESGTILLVVDSPGSYSTLKLKKGGDGNGEGTTQERQYPMKFLLDHTLLSVAKGKWEKVYSRDSKWWRRDAVRLWYDVGEGAGLEDMRFQIHVYRRLK
ncbi:hypothetical protein BJY04DRAFT_220231 [Aspergillus karnatakaensis]|uniref:25S rRNA (uracil2843-N3)-methyltransferase n=1 Tax=Aspergillus karnatakaensis TaxID=1810916 RepID=UPI003CCCD3FA